MKIEARILVKHGMTRAEVHETADAAGVPMDAVLSVSTTQGDRPWESGTTSLVWTWEV
jgi:hypothetical protein